jgi:hypothetical protein
MFMKMARDIFKPYLQPQPAFDRFDEEMKRGAETLEVKRRAAIEYLGDKWILKGGQYSRDNKQLEQK